MGFKQAIVLRTDLGMGKGKLVAQGSHASIEAFQEASAYAKSEWRASGCEKIVTKVSSARELSELKKKAVAMGLPQALIRDAGHTQIPAGSITALAIGPAEEDKIDEVTGKLKLL